VDTLAFTVAVVGKNPVGFPVTTETAADVPETDVTFVGVPVTVETATTVPLAAVRFGASPLTLLTAAIDPAVTNIAEAEPDAVDVVVTVPLA